MRGGAPYHGYFATAWQPSTAASNTVTYLSTTVGSPGAAAGAATGVPLLLRLCRDVNCAGIVAHAQPQIVNYGETAADIGDVAVTPGATYYLVWYQPAALNRSTWVTYWWAGGLTIGTSDLMQGVGRLTSKGFDDLIDLRTGRKLTTCAVGTEALNVVMTTRDDSVRGTPRSRVHEPRAADARRLQERRTRAWSQLAAATVRSRTARNHR
jgi:hypothetical protein